MSYYIYKICCDDLPNYNYIGSTKAFRQRKSQHKMNYNEGNTRKIYNTIRENGGWDNWRIVILEELGVVSFTEARIKEEEHRVKLNANLNMNKCYRTEEDHLKQMKEWRENNKEHIAEYKKEYQQKNKEHIAKQNKEYKEQNKEAIAEKHKEKITCECGCVIRKKDLARHKKTNKHLELMKYLEKI
jgi:hypothetical protein